MNNRTIQNSMEQGVSVIVCCYNSANRIQKTLEALAGQDVPSDIQWEVILVNNNSSDNTVEVAKSVWKNTGCNTQFSVVNEPRPGLAFAKEKGMSSAKYEILIYCDDDNWLDENYVRVAFETMQNDRKIGVLGGRSEAASDEVLPFWFHTYQGSYAVGVQGIDTGYVSRRKYVWGAGSVTRKSVLERMGKAGFKPLLKDREGNKLSSGSDAELCRWFLLTGFEIYYHEDLLFKHYVPEQRLTKEYLRKIHQGFGAAFSKLSVYDSLLEMKGNKYKHIFRLPFYFAEWILFLILWRKKKKASIEMLAANLEASNPFPFSIFSLDVYRLKKNISAFHKVAKNE